jgi:ligand-binding sensor domain-containing protein/signal transduction histidine kinase
LPAQGIFLRVFWRVLLLGVLLLASLPHPAQAQSSSIRFETLSVENGLSQSTVRAIFQDDKGFMWFGTDDGLNKYDGYTFTIYKHDPENNASLSDNTITAIYEDQQGDLWLGTASGLDRFQPEQETFEHFFWTPSKYGSLHGTGVNAIVEDKHGSLWIGTTDGGLNRFNRESKTFTNFTHDPHNASSIASDSIQALFPDAKGGLWVGTYDGLDYLDAGQDRFTHYQNRPDDPKSLSDNRVLAVYQDRMGILWAGTEEGGLNSLMPNQNVFTRYRHREDNPYSLSSDLVNVIYEDQGGQLWVGGRTGLNKFERSSDYFTRYQHDPNNLHSLSNDTVVSIYSDRSGVLWIGTFGGGISKYVQNNDRFRLYQHMGNIPNSLSNDVVYAIAEDREGVVWVGTMDGGLNRLDPESNTFTSFQNNPADPTSLGSNDVRAILEDRQQRLWVGTNGGGLNLFNRDTNRFTRFLHDSSKPDSLADNRIMAIYQDRKGKLWVGTRSAGLDLFDPDTGSFTHYRYKGDDPSSLSGDFVRTITEDRSGQLWVGTYSGISVMDPNRGRFHRYQADSNNPNSLSNNRVLSIRESSDGIVWIGTLLGGLNRFDPATNTFRHFTQKQGLPSDAVYGILPDRMGALWMSTSRGLSRFDPKIETFRNYDRSDGLQSYEFNAGAYFESSHGLMYFGGIRGFNAFDPARVADNPRVPQVVITAFKKFNQIDRKDLVGGEKITLNYSDNFISFEFAALDYGAPEKNQYAYQLIGFDPGWINAGTRRYASYTNLHGGTYTFRVIGSNQDGVWNQEGASVEIVVVPPFWENGWFVGSVGLLLISAAIFGFRYRVVRIQTQNRNLEEQVRERTQEIERRREVAEGLREILTILNSNRSLKESLDAIIVQVVRVMEARGVILFRCGEEGYPLVIASNLFDRGSATFQQAMPNLPGWIAAPLLQGLNISIPDLMTQRKEHPDLDDSPIGRYAALLGVPLQVSDKIDGGLVLLYENPRVTGEEDMQMAASFADHAALAIANAQLRSQAEETAVSAERSRLARDLHDAVTQTLFATSLIAEVLPRLWDRNPEAAQQKIAEIRELTRGALAEMRTLLMELRPSALVDVMLPDLLQQLGEAFTGRARVPVKLSLEKSVDLPTNVKIGLYRITQEALNNVQKHARASHVEICLKDLGQQIQLIICDDGIGFVQGVALPDHFGLGIMEERAQSFGARFNITSRPGSGSTITVTWDKDTFDHQG